MSDSQISIAHEKLPWIKVPQSKLGRFFFFAGTQFLSYFVFVANTRAFTSGLYGWTALTDGWLAMQGFIMIRLISKGEGDGFWELAGTVLGGVAGSLSSIWVTKHLYGH